MKTILSIVTGVIVFFIFIYACERRKDPFSVLNKDPVIQEFAFDNDSLKFKNKPFYLKLRYEDEEAQELTASFNFLSGAGDITTPTGFSNKIRKPNSIIFTAPAEFNNRLTFIPDTPGVVEIQLLLSDKVKISSEIAETYIYSNLEPVARFTAILRSTASPYDLELDASASYDPDNGKIEYYYWWFGDNTPMDSTRSKIYHHYYQRSGIFTVRLKVVDDDGGSDIIDQAITTSNQPPSAYLKVTPISGKAPLAIQYTAGNSRDPDGKVVSYRIDFGDGGSSLDSAGTHVYLNDNNYRVKLTVEDNLGETDTTGVTVRVSTPPVVVLNVAPVSGPFPLKCLIDGTGSYDPQGGKIDHDIYIDDQLAYDNVDSVRHTFNQPNQYLVRMVITNARNGLTSEAQKSVNVINLSPVADFTWNPPRAQHMTPVTYTSTSKDPNKTDKIAWYKWTFPPNIIEQGEDKAIVTQTFDAGVDTYRVKLEVWDTLRGTNFQGYDFIEYVIPKLK